MEASLTKLDHLLQQLIFDAGYAMVYAPFPDVEARCRRQYRLLVRRLVRLRPGLAGRLPDPGPSASAGCIRLAARSARVVLTEERHRLRARRRADRPDLAWLFDALFSA